MLVLTRKVGERIVIDEQITLVVNRISGERVSIGIEAPADISIKRGEIASPWHPVLESLPSTVTVPAAQRS